MQEVFAGRLFKTRGGAVLIGGVAAVLAAILLIVYLHSYRSSVNSGTRPMTVLVAKSLIPRGTSGSLIAQAGLYQVTTVPKDQLKTLAIVDPAGLNSRVTVADIYPGQQITQNDLSTEGVYSIPSQIVGNKRAIAIPVDSVHGLTGTLETGDHIDVYMMLAGTGSPVLKLLASNVLVLSPPTAGSGGGVSGGSSGSNAILRVTTHTAPKFAYAADNGRLWFILRPQVRSSPTPNASVTASTLLNSSPTVGG